MQFVQSLATVHGGADTVTPHYPVWRVNVPFWLVFNGWRRSTRNLNVNQVDLCFVQELWDAGRRGQPMLRVSLPSALFRGLLQRYVDAEQHILVVLCVVGCGGR